MDNMSFAPFDSEMESYFDFGEQGFLHSPMSGSPTFGYASSDTIDPVSMMSGANGGERQRGTSGPSHQYADFPQLTGLPAGAMSSVSAYNDIADASFDFNYASNPTINYNTGIDMDMDFGAMSQAPMQPYMLTSTFQPGGQFSGTNTLAPPPTLAVPRQQNRLWPGMHSQQAEQAKADALARQQHQQQMGQQIMQQRQLQISTPQPITSRPASSQAQADPVVEERISRIFDSMRHNSMVPSVDDDADSANGDEGSRSARMRKDEEDMDDDERLLASEQGKKLSSKERRQLRNKVSARAFRSRRKEYIGQLEGEVAVKTTECNELKARNRHLVDQNQQLTSLTRTLLSHPAFQTFLNDMSNDPEILKTLSEVPQQTALPMKQENTSSSRDTQVNRVQLPQQNMDMSMYGGNNHWNSSTPSINFQQPQVYSVLELPQPRIEQNLSGKSEYSFTAEASKLDAPKLQLPCFAIVDKVETTSELSSSVEFDESEYALYVDTPCTPYTSTTSNTTTTVNPKSTTTITLITSTAIANLAAILTPDAAILQINATFDSLNPTFARLGDLTSHLC